MRFDCTHCAKIQQAYQYDAELSSVTVEYKDRLATVILHYSRNDEVTLIFRNVKYVCIPIHEPWGVGMYVCSIETTAREDGQNFETTYYSGETTQPERAKAIHALDSF